MRSVASHSRFPRLNLASRDATELTIMGSFHTEEGASILGPYAERPPEADAVLLDFFATYATRDRRKTQHVIEAMLWRADDSPEELRLSISYETGRLAVSSGSKRSKQEATFISTVQLLGTANWMRASVEFRLEVPDERVLAIPLPFKLENSELSIPRGEIRGLHVVLPEDSVLNRPELDMVIDRPFGEELFVDVRFNLPPDPSVIQHLPEVALQGAASVARSLLQGADARSRR